MIRLRRTVGPVIVAVATTTLGVPPALADDPCSNPLTHQACASAHDGRIQVGATRTRHSSRNSGKDSSADGYSWAAMAAAYCTDATANASAGKGALQAVVDICRGFAAVPIGPGRDDVVRAFKELPLYRGQIRTEPRRWTLVNLETYFWCGDDQGRSCDVVGEGEKTVILLGQPVRVRPRIVSYSWTFGDGFSAEVTDRAAHTYVHAGSRTVTLTLTWTADYALGAGTFQPINDTTTTASAPRVLPVREAQTVIVSEG